MKERKSIALSDSDNTTSDSTSNQSTTTIHDIMTLNQQTKEMWIQTMNKQDREECICLRTSTEARVMMRE